MPLPNTNNGQSKDQAQPDFTESINAFLGNITERLNAVFDVKESLKSGVFGAFGNNALTRAAGQGIDAVSESIKSIFGGESAEEKDPVVAALKEQTAAITVLADTLTNQKSVGDSNLDLVDEDLNMLRRDIKANREFEKVEANTQIGLLTDIRTLLEKGGPRDSDAQYSNDIDDEESPIVDLSGRPFDTTPRKVLSDQLLIENSVESKQVDDIKKQVESNVDSVESKQVDDNEPITSPKSKIGLLQKILSVLMSTSKNIEKMTKVEPISTREADIESIRARNAGIKQATAVQDIKEGEKNNKFDFTRLFKGLFDLDANLMGMSKVFKLAVDAIKIGITGVIATFGLLKGGIVDLVKWIADMFKGGGSGIPSVDLPDTQSNPRPSKTPAPSSAKDIVKSIARGGINLLKSAAPLTIAAGVGTTLYAGYQWSKDAKITGEDGELTTTGKIIDSTQRALGGQGVKPMTPLTGVKKIESDADIGWLDIFGTKKAAHKKHYEASFQLGTKYTPEEAEALTKHFDIKVPEGNIKKAIDSTNFEQIEVAQKDLKQVENTPQSDSSKQSAPVVVANNSNVTNNQTIMPTRTVVENNERSYQRYLNNMFAATR